MQPPSEGRPVIQIKLLMPVNVAWSGMSEPVLFSEVLAYPNLAVSRLKIVLFFFPNADFCQCQAFTAVCTHQSGSIGICKTGTILCIALHWYFQVIDLQWFTKMVIMVEHENYWKILYYQIGI